jgi:hypothetical protein
MPLALLARDLLLLRRGPQDAPYSPRLLITLVLAVLVFDAVLTASVPGNAGIGARLVVAAVVASLFTLLAMSALLLQLGGRQARYVQTAIALVLVELALSIASVPFAAFVGEPPAAGQALAPGQALATLGFVAIGVWGLLVRGHILRHALEIGFVRGVLLALAITLAEGVMVLAVIGRSTTQAAGLSG